MDLSLVQIVRPEKRTVRALEHLALFGNRFDCGFQRRPAIGNAERSGINFADHQFDTAPD